MSLRAGAAQTETPNAASRFGRAGQRVVKESLAAAHDVALDSLVDAPYVPEAEADLAAGARAVPRLVRAPPALPERSAEQRPPVHAAHEARVRLRGTNNDIVVIQVNEINRTGP